MTSRIASLSPRIAPVSAEAVAALDAKVAAAMLKQAVELIADSGIADDMLRDAEPAVVPDYVDGVNPKVAMSAPSAKPLHVPHVADPANRFADQMQTFDNMREINAEFRRLAKESK